jgi:hypothetical protein
MRRWMLAGAVIAIAVAVVGIVWFQPQKLFIDVKVSETAPPTTAPVATSSATPEPSLQGTFTSGEHDTKGTATARDGTLRFEGFSTSNGPDVRVYLSTGMPFGKDFIDLGALKGNIGDQNYVIPSGTDLAKYRYAVVWCRRFTVSFGHAELS